MFLNIQTNVKLAPFTTFKIGGPAKFFVEVKNTDELAEAVKWAEENNESCFALGGGSNLLISDVGFNGLVIKMNNIDYEVTGEKIKAGAGALLSRLAQAAVEHNLTGLEWTVGLPGTVGGAVCGNAGWPRGKKSMADVVEKVEVFANRQIKSYNMQDCQFQYRDSIFKSNHDIIFSVILKLKKGDVNKIKQDMRNILQKRRERIPSGYSAGCVFKNPVGHSAGELIDKAGLKGKQIGGARISERHANFIINTGLAKAEDVYKLLNLAKKEVKDILGVELEEEIQMIGF